MPSGSKSSERAPPRGVGDSASAFLALLGRIQTRQERRLRAVLGARQARADAHGPAVHAMVAAVRELTLRKGKRLRPALVALGLLAADARADLAPAVEVGAALELLHTYLLIHY